MLHKINPPNVPWSNKIDWDSFGAEYTSIELKREHLSNEILTWLDVVGLKPINANMLTIFPDKEPPILVNSPICEVVDHGSLYWVYDVPVEYTWYKITAPIGLENQESLLSNPGEYEEAGFGYPYVGWAVNPDLLEIQGREIINFNEAALLNTGVPYKLRVTSQARARVFRIGIEEKTRLVSSSINGISYKNAKDLICSAQI